MKAAAIGAAMIGSRGKAQEAARASSPDRCQPGRFFRPGERHFRRRRGDRCPIFRALRYRPRGCSCRQGDVDLLVKEGYLARNGDLYELTAKAEKVLTDRGAGLNEA